MQWSSGQSVTGGSIATSIDRLFVFGAVDAYKDLVSGTTYAGSLNGTAAFGSDAIGTYVEAFATGDYLTTGAFVQTITDTDYSLFVTFSRSGTIPNYAQLFAQVEDSGGYMHALQCDLPPTTINTRYNSVDASIAHDLSSIPTNAEFTVVVTKTGTTGKYFYKGGSSPISFVSPTFTGSKLLTQLQVAGWGSFGQIPYRGRFRAYGRWNRALSDAEAQSMADNPQQIIASAVTYTYARPTSDITTQWTPSAGIDHYALIDEPTASDADYISATAAGQTDEVKLAAMTAPQAGTDLLINYRVQGIVGSATVTMSLRQGSAGTLIATDTAKNTNNTYQLVVPAATWASVTDWTDMRLRFVSA